MTRTSSTQRSPNSCTSPSCSSTSGSATMEHQCRRSTNYQIPSGRPNSHQTNKQASTPMVPMQATYSLLVCSYVLPTPYIVYYNLFASCSRKDECSCYLNLTPKGHADIPFGSNQMHVVAMLKLSFLSIKKSVRSAYINPPVR